MVKDAGDELPRLSKPLTKVQLEGMTAQVARTNGLTESVVPFKKTA